MVSRQTKKADWDALKEAFLFKFGGGNNPEELWPKILSLQQTTLGSYQAYEIEFLKLWAEWEISTLR